MIHQYHSTFTVLEKKLRAIQGFNETDRSIFSDIVKEHGLIVQTILKLQHTNIVFDMLRGYSLNEAVYVGIILQPAVDL